MADEITIDLEAGEPDKKAAEKPAKAAEPPAGEDLEEGLKKLQSQLDDERSRRIAAERDAAESRQLEVNARSQSQNDQLNLLTTGIENAKAVGAQLRNEYAEAAAAGDWAKAAEVQEAMAENSGKKIQMESAKKIMEKRGKPEPRQPSDPVESFVSTMTPKSAEWVRSHPEFVHDPKLTRKMLRAHEDALDEGLRADTPEYFKSVEMTLGISKRDEPEGEEPTSAAAAPARKAAPAAAPVSRSGSGAGERPGTVRLTPEEVEVAKMNGLTPEEYAKNKLDLKRDKRIN